MTTPKNVHLESVRSIRDELLQLIDGMDYCLDWKPDTASWSVREVVYHLLETPQGGMHRLVKGVLSQEVPEFDLTPDLNNITPQHLGYDMEQVRAEIEEFFKVLEKAVAEASEEDLATRSTLAHLKARGRDEERTAQMLLEGLFARHWREHLAQIREVRETLGV